MPETISYAKHKGFLNFNWNKFLDTKELTDEQWKDAMEVVRHWVTAPSGAQDHRIPREQSGRPTDKELTDLEQEFYSSILEKNIKQCKKYLYKIEVRSIQIVNEITNGNN